MAYLVPCASFFALDPGSWTLIKEVTLTANKTEVLIDGLNINTHRAYIIICKIENATTSTALYYLFVEGEETLSNYRSHYIYGGGVDGDTLAMGRDEFPPILHLVGNSVGLAVIHLVLDPRNRARWLAHSSRRIGSNVEQVIRSATCLTSMTNITKIKIASDTASAIKAGSKIEVYGFKPVEEVEVSAVLEGDYTSWALEWSADIGGLGGYGLCFAGFNTGAKRVIVRGGNGVTACYDLATGAQIWQKSFYWAGGTTLELSSSVMGKYTVLMGLNEIRIYKQGALQQNISFPGSDLRGLAMSPDGKIIIAYDYYYDKIYCYKAVGAQL